MAKKSLARDRIRHASLALLALSSSALLAGCQLLPEVEVQPWAVAHHDEKIAFHKDAGDALLNLDATAGLASLKQFQAVGFHHVEASDWRVHLEYQSSVDGEGFVSKFSSSKTGYSFDQSHQAGSGDTYYLLGDELKKQASNGKSWVQVPIGDLGRMQDPQRACNLFAVAFSCNLIEAWNITRESMKSVPVKLATSETGEQHFTTAVSIGALDEAGLKVRSSNNQGLDASLPDDTLVPFHIWVNEDGIINKMEVNGVAEDSSGGQVKLQIGFEITSFNASSELVPFDPCKIPPKDLYQITTPEQLKQFVERLHSA